MSKSEIDHIAETLYELILNGLTMEKAVEPYSEIDREKIREAIIELDMHVNGIGI